jgi:hypothetical protein
MRSPEREVIARGVFTSVSDLARKLRRYINGYSSNAKPIQWKCSDSFRRIRSNELASATRERRFDESLPNRVFSHKRLLRHSPRGASE